MRTFNLEWKEKTSLYMGFIHRPTKLQYKDGQRRKICQNFFSSQKNLSIILFLHCSLIWLQPGRLDLVCGQSLFSLVLAIFAHLSPPQIFDWFRKQAFLQFLANWQMRLILGPIFGCKERKFNIANYDQPGHNFWVKGKLKCAAISVMNKTMVPFYIFHY